MPVSTFWNIILLPAAIKHATQNSKGDCDIVQQAAGSDLEHLEQVTSHWDGEVFQDLELLPAALQVVAQHDFLERVLVQFQQGFLRQGACGITKLQHLQGTRANIIASHRRAEWLELTCGAIWSQNIAFETSWKVSSVSELVSYSFFGPPPKPN